MAELSPLEAKIIKQIEYYLGDISLTRDKFMKQVITENDGWISFDTMLKFNRLKTLTEDVNIIKVALSKSSSGLLEVGPNGIRRNPNLAVPESFDDAFLACKDRSVYVKGFNVVTTLDEIIEWLEKHGGKTINVHTRRLPKDKKFKGSLFAIFETKEEAERLLNSPDASVFGKNSTIRMYRDDYFEKKKAEKNAKHEARVERNAAMDAARAEQVSSWLYSGALLELSGLPDPKNPLLSKSLLNHKTNHVKPLATNNPKFPPSLRVVLKAPNTAENAWAKLTKAFGEKPVVYSGSAITGLVLSGDEEIAHWKTVLAAQMHKAQKRRGGHRNGKTVGNKRRRTN
ncbi:putative Lupus la ribonucleoprotein [Fasciolopsis buskii]|uniref:Putative Lupus la ribonucleoprotein n=1 Tax=Fasciolopsis buskii TaxID=27845 RepID=A0A8E0VMC6_9TREM|nr:putative Lupus la ribonucleoprotein [Fasciolopsis buski]